MKKSVTISTTDPVPSTSAPLPVNRGGTGRTDLANQINGLAAASTASSTNRLATVNEVTGNINGSLYRGNIASGDYNSAAFWRNNTSNGIYWYYPDIGGTNALSQYAIIIVSRGGTEVQVEWKQQSDGQVWRASCNNVATTMTWKRYFQIGLNSKNDIGLDNVDNTSDMAKPISTATQNALNAKVYIASRGAVANELGTSLGQTGLSTHAVYNNGYPIPYGNVISTTANGGGQLLLGWSGISGAHANSYVRSKRDTSDDPWSAWAKILTDINISENIASTSTPGFMSAADKVKLNSIDDKVINSMAGNETDKAPSIASVKTAISNHSISTIKVGSVIITLT